MQTIKPCLPPKSSRELQWCHCLRQQHTHDIARICGLLGWAGRAQAPHAPGEVTRALRTTVAGMMCKVLCTSMMTSLMVANPPRSRCCSHVRGARHDRSSSDSAVLAVKSSLQVPYQQVKQGHKLSSFCFELQLNSDLSRLASFQTAARAQACIAVVP